MVQILALAAFVGQAPLSGVESLNELSGYSTILHPAPFASMPGGKLIYRLDMKDVKTGESVEIRVVRFDRYEQLTSAIATSREHVQAATVAMPVPEIAALGYDSYYVGNLQVLEFDSIAYRTWINVRLHNPGISSEHSGRLARADAARALHDDGGDMELLRVLLPDLRRRVVEATAP